MPEQFFWFGHIEVPGEEGQQCRLWWSAELCTLARDPASGDQLAFPVEFPWDKRSEIAAQVQLRKADDVETAQIIEPLEPFCYALVPVAALGVFLVIVFEVVKSIRNR